VEWQHKSLESAGGSQTVLFSEQKGKSDKGGKSAKAQFTARRVPVKSKKISAQQLSTWK